MHIYLIDIDYEDKEILITKTEKLLWDFIPINPAAFDSLLNDFPDYTLLELDEWFLRDIGFRHSYLNPN